MRVLILGASGMLGNAMIRVLSEKADWHVYGTIRSESSKRFFSGNISERLISGIDVEHNDALMQAFIHSCPDVVINCVGLIKQLAEAEDPLQAIPINSLLPHRLARLCELSGARLIHMSTDCIFSGDKGGYLETDLSDAKDLYGKSKLLGEVPYRHSITLRTSIIGHELQSRHGLINWFLAQDKQCKGFSQAIFSGLPTVVLAKIIRDVVIPNEDLFGVYHVASQPITKYNLLKLVADVYGKSIDIVPDDKLKIDCSLNADRFKNKTGYKIPSWPELVQSMYFYR